VLSATVTVKLQFAVLPDGSVAVQLTVVGPSGKLLPEGGLQLGVTVPAHVSLPVAV
jgi:hypothetical protein